MPRIQTILATVAVLLVASGVGAGAGLFGRNPISDAYCGGDGYRCGAGDLGECTIKVENVVCGVQGSGNYGQMSVQPAVFSVCGKKTMVWELHDARYKFTADGIALKASDPSFDPKDASPQPQRFSWVNQHLATGHVDYGVTIQKANGTPCAHIDPFIYNE